MVAGHEIYAPTMKESAVPTYVYACTECGHRFEQYQAFTDAALTECPECGSRLRKVFNSVGVVFKGSGFYRNDSRGKDSAADGKGPDKGADAGTGSDGKSSDAKSDSKSSDGGTGSGSKSSGGNGSGNGSGKGSGKGSGSNGSGGKGSK